MIFMKRIDFENGNIVSNILKAALPMLVAQIMSLLYNIVDRIYIGRIPLEGKLALTGMGVTFPVITLISAFSALVGMGGAPRASIALGAGEKDRAERTLGTCAAALCTVWSAASRTATCTLVRVVPAALLAVPVSAMPLLVRMFTG